MVDSVLRFILRIVLFQFKKAVIARSNDRHFEQII